MKKTILFCALVLLVAAPVCADESPQVQLEFVRKLRAKGYADLAMEHLERMKQGAPAELQAILSLEAARAQIDMAHNKTSNERLAMIKAARKDLETYIKTVAGAPAARGKLELARLIVHQGKAQLAVAFGEEDAAEKQNKANVAEALFVEAGTQLEAAADMLAKAAAAEKDNAAQKQMEQEQLEAKLERGIAYMEQCDSYYDLSKEELNLKRAQIAQKSMQTFQAAAKEGGLTNPASLLAAAWLMRAYHEMQDPTKASDQFEAVLKQSSELAIPAKRLVRYFRMLTIPGDATIKTEKFLVLQAHAKAWLNDYPRAHDTPEGQGVRFELGKALFQKAEQLARDPKAPKGDAARYYEESKKYLSELAEGHGEYSSRAAAAVLQSSLKLLDKTSPLSALKGFNDPYLRGRQELLDMSNSKDKAKREGHLKNAIEAFQVAMAQAPGDKSASPLKISETKYLLTWAFTVKGDLLKAIEQGEALARADPAEKHSASAAGYTLEAYAALLAGDDSKENRAKFASFAKFILEDKKKVWGEEPVTAVTIYHMSQLNYRSGKLEEAVALLEKLPTDFSGYDYAQGQAVFFALQGEKNTKDEKQKEVFRSKALAALERMKLQKEANASTIAIYFLAKLQQPEMLFTDGARLMADARADEVESAKLLVESAKLLADAKVDETAKKPTEAAQKVKESETKVKESEKRLKDAEKKLQDAETKFKDMQKVSAKLNTEYIERREQMSQENADRIGEAITRLKDYEMRGMTDIEFRRGNYAKVLEITKSFVGRVMAGAKDQQPIALLTNDYKVSRYILEKVLAADLRINALQGNFKETVRIADALARLLHMVEVPLEQILFDDKVAASFDPALLKQHADLLQEALAKESKFVSVVVLKDEDPAKAPVPSIRWEPKHAKFVILGYPRHFYAAKVAGLQAVPASLEEPSNWLGIISEQIEKVSKETLGKSRETALANLSNLVSAVAKTKATFSAGEYFQLAKALDILGNNCKAAEMYAKVPAPSCVDKMPPLTQEEEREVQVYWYARVQHARQLRLCKEDKTNPEKAYKVLQEILSNSNARQHMRAEFEATLVLEAVDPPRWSAAINRWSKFLSNKVVLDNMKKDAGIEEMYYEGYYHYVLSCVSYSKQKDVQEKKMDVVFLNRAADWIVRMELDNPVGWQIVGPRLVELLNGEALLIFRCQELKDMRKKDTK